MSAKFPFGKVIEDGGGFSNPLFAGRFLWGSGVSAGRAALVVSKKVGGAVVRNRTRRRLREALRRGQPLPEGLDLLIIARPGIVTARFQEVEETLRESMAKIGTNP